MSVLRFDGHAPAAAAPFGSIADLKGRVDFAVITIKPEEFEAACRHLAHAAVLTGARSYAMARVPAGEGGRVGAAVVAITRCPSQGNGISQDVARDIIDDLDPQWILVLGIAGAAPAAELTLGDVALASSLIDVSVEAVKHGRAPEFAAEGRLVHEDVENFVTMVAAHEAALGPWYELCSERPPVSLEDARFYGDRGLAARGAGLALVARGGAADAPSGRRGADGLERPAGQGRRDPHPVDEGGPADPGD
jgi:hypothetical protein